MCIGRTPAAPAAPPPPQIINPTEIPEETRQPKLAGKGAREARDTQKAKARQTGSRGGTLLTGPQGLTTAANTQKKTLLGA